MTDVDISADDRTRQLEADTSLGELFARLSKDFSQLVSTQVALAKVELKDEVAHASKGAGLLGGGAVAGHLALVLLSFAAAWGLATQMPTGFAFLIIGIAWGVLAALLATSGRKEFRAVHPVPPQTIQALREDVEWLRQQTR